MRKCSIEFGQEFGTCVASIGNTRALAHVSCSLDRPSEVRPSEGKIVFKVELPPLASPSFELNKKSAFAIDLNRLLEKAIVQSRCIDIEELCVRAGEQCWTLRVEVTALNHEGNLSDALCLAAMGALMHFKRPEVTVDGHDVKIHTADEKEPTRLTLHHKPFCVTIGYIEDGRTDSDGDRQKILVLDPVRQEEQVLSGIISIAINKHREICAMRVSGNRELDSSQILSCTKIAAAKVKDLQSLIESAIKKDDKQRKKGRIPRVNCTVMDSFLGDLGDINDILEQISNIKMEAQPDIDAVKEDEPMNQDDYEEVEEVVESKPDVAEVEVITPKTESNWSETEKWFDTEKQVFVDKSETAKAAQDTTAEDDSDEEEAVNITASEFK